MAPWVASAATLTGINVFTTTPTGSLAGGHGGYHNTYGGDNTSFNGYVLRGLPGASLGGDFLNAGNLTVAPTRIAVDLGTPGLYGFTVVADTSAGGAEVSPHWGINLFFDGDDLTPRLSAFGLTNLTGPNHFPAFDANGSPATATLNPLSMGYAPGSGGLTWQSGSLAYTLTSYRVSSSTVFGVDRVTGFDLGPGGTRDMVSEFTLQVSSVPEAGTLPMFGLGVLAVAGWRRLRNTRRGA